MFPFHKWLLLKLTGTWSCYIIDDFPAFWQEFESVLKEFKDELTTYAYSSSFVVVMTHGDQNTMHLNNVETVDVYEDILKQFNEVNFPEFDGMPKVFILQGCQTYPSTGSI